jgi:hypothetical protein
VRQELKRLRVENLGIAADKNVGAPMAHLVAPLYPLSNGGFLQKNIRVPPQLL